MRGESVYGWKEVSESNNKNHDMSIGHHCSRVFRCSRSHLSKWPGEQILDRTDSSYDRFCILTCPES